MREVQGGTAPLPCLLAAVGLVLIMASLGVAQEAKPKTPADIVILDAAVWTGVEGESEAPPTALAIQGSKIVAVGNNASVSSLIGPSTRVINARGRRVIPGITDSHTHVISAGLQLARLYLRDAKERTEFIGAIESSANGKKPGEWLLGGRWSVESWADPTPPDKAWLDPVTGETPVFLTRMDGHQALVNSVALSMAGIDANGPDDPEGGEIERDPATREPTGILKESAMGLVSRLIPDPSPSQMMEALKRAMKHANSNGVTSIHDMSGMDELRTLRRAHREGALTLRVTTFLSVSDWGKYLEKVTRFGVSDDSLRIAGFKGFMDGSLGSRTAYMREPYSDIDSHSPYPRGQLTAMANPPENFRKMVVEADAQEWQLAVHAIGDQANHLLLNAYQQAGATNERKGALHRIEHAQHLLVEDIPRFARLGVVASMQPFHKADDGRYAEKRLGSKRLVGSYAFRALLDSGALLCFGSDWPVVTVNPFAGIDSAVNARTLAGNVWLKDHSLTVEEALRAYTVNPARAIHREDRLGTIEPGKLADIVILAADLLTMPIDQIGKMQVWQTIMNGKIVYSHPE